MKSLLCIDPGGTNGFARFRWSKKHAAVLTHAFEVESDPEDLWRTMESWRIREPPEHNLILLAEDWETRDSPADARHACEPLGIISLFCQRYDIPMVRQRPFERAAVPDDKEFLEPLGYWTALEGHARQATRHGLVYIARRQRHLPTLEKLFPRPV